ncbi:MAG: hypothetical protein Q7T55_12855 [Solirubrobacteraceae bacterium]|nr:hypothetical protein [Solirubrobacteraceae bacterium]
MLTTLRSGAAAVLLTACLSLSACGSDDGDKAETSGTKTETTAEATPKLNEYPTELTDEYTKSCVPSAVNSSNGKLTEDDAGVICQNTLECIQKELTSDEFIQTSTKMMSGEENPGAKTFTDCATEAGKNFKK